MNFIKKVSKDLYNKINKTNIISVKTSSTENNMLNIKKSYNGHEYCIHSNYHPYEQARYIAEYALKDNSDIVFFFGLGLGYELEEMLKRDETKRYFIIEPDVEIFKLALNTFDINIINNKNIYFIQDDRYENIVSFMEAMILNDKKLNIKFVVSPAYEVIYSRLIKEINEFIVKWLNVFTVNLNTNILYQRQWFQNYIANLKYLAQTRPVKILEKDFEGKPAVIVGAGPSLNNNLEHIRKVQDSMILAGAGTGITVLDKNLIRAHIAGAIDGTIHEEKLFANLQVNKDVALFYSNNVYHTVPGKVDGKKFLINVNNMDNYIDKSLGWGDYEVYSSASISIIMAYNLAKLGCNPVILLGQDFCFSRNRNYSEGVEEIKGNNEISEDILKRPGCMKVKNKNGDEVYTNKGFIAMRDLMENCIQMFPKTTFLNGTKEGLEIKGALNIDFNDYIDSTIEGKNYQISDIIDQAGCMAENDRNSASGLIKSISFDINEVKNLCMDILSCIEGAQSTSAKGDLVKKKEMKLKEIPFYNEVIFPTILEIEYIYMKRDYLEYCKGMYSYILDKCLIMENAMKYEVYGEIKNV